MYSKECFVLKIAAAFWLWYQWGIRGSVFGAVYVVFFMFSKYVIVKCFYYDLILKLVVDLHGIRFGFFLCIWIKLDCLCYCRSRFIVMILYVIPWCLLCLLCLSFLMYFVAQSIVEVIELMDGLIFFSHCMFTWIFMCTLLALSLLLRLEGF